MRTFSADGKKELHLTSEVSLGTKESRPHVLLRGIVEGRSMVVESYLAPVRKWKKCFSVGFVKTIEYRTRIISLTVYWVESDRFMYTINETTAEKLTDGRRMKQRLPKLKLVSWEIIDWKRLCPFFKLNKSHIIDVMFKTYD